MSKRKPGYDALYQANLYSILNNEEGIKKYSSYFNTDYLNGLLITKRALGYQILEQYKVHFGEHMAYQLEQYKNLELHRKNKRKLG